MEGECEAAFVEGVGGVVGVVDDDVIVIGVVVGDEVPMEMGLA